MSSGSSCKCPANQYESAKYLVDEKSPHGNGQSENAKLRSEIECLKKCLKARLEQLKEQEEFTRDLEEKLIKTKMDLAVLQEKNTKQDGQNVSLGCTSVSDTAYSLHYTLLSCLMHKLEDLLKNLCAKSNCCPNCKISIEKELEKLRLVKNELEKSKIQNISSETCSEDFKSCNELYRYEGKVCSSGHLEDVEKFKEKAVTGVAALEKMREQVDILENLIRKQHTNFSCVCDEMQIKECEEKLEKCRSEFDRISGELCAILQNDFKSGLKDSLDSFLPLPSTNTEVSLLSEEICNLKCECVRLEKEINKQENLVECLKKTAKDLEQEIRCKRMELVEQTSEIESRACEIIKTRSLIKKVCRRMKEQGCSRGKILDENPPSPKQSDDLNMLFCELSELWCLLETSTVPTTSTDAFQKLTEENEKLKKQLDCLEKCVINKDETMRILHDTVKLKECHIEELKSKVETVESRSSKLNQDVEEKCRLISNLQEAIRKCKQLETHRTQVETLQFELCDLDCTLKKYEKEIHRKNSMIEKLHEKLTDITAENINLTEKISIIKPKLKIVYKTCDLFEEMVCDLQEVIRDKEGEIECLYGKIKDLENELESEFKKCEFRASEDSKCIEELTLRLKNFQSEYTCAQESYNASLAVLESRLKNEEEAGHIREKELYNTISQLKMQLKSAQSQMLNTSPKHETSSRVNELEALLKQAESRLQMYDVRMSDLQKELEITTVEREEERNVVLRKLCEEKKENIKNKTLVTELNETIKLISLNEKILKERLQNIMEDYENVRIENDELRNEIEAWKKISTDEGNNETNLSELEKLICSLKIQKTELKSKCSNLKAEVDKEMKLRKILENRVEDLNTTLQNKLLEFNHIIESYKNTSSRLQQTLTGIKEVEKNFMSMEHKMRDRLDCNSDDEHEYLKKLLNIKTAENAKLICQIQILQVDIESKQNESIMTQTSNDAIMGQLRHEIFRLENAIQEFQEKSRTLHEENIKLRNELNCTSERELSMRMEFREKQKELCAKLRSTICEKNDLLNSLDELQKRLEEICIDNLNKEKINKELSEECSRLKSQNDSNENNLRNKPDKIICQLTTEIKTLHCDLSMLKENYDALDKDYKNLLNDYKCCEKKKCNLEKLYAEVSNENQALMDLKMKYEKDLCELNTQNLLLKDKLSTLGDSFRNVEDKQKLYEKIKELTIKVRTLEKNIIPPLEEEITSKNCCIENLTMELREANISSQRMRNEATRVMQCTKKYLAAQRCANEALLSRLECSNKRGNALGAENRELEEQLKAVTRMNEFLLNQLEGNKCDTGETEPRSFSPLPWSCSTVERDTSSSEYLTESGFQSMQPSPTNMEIDYDSQNECKRMTMQWNSSRKSKCGGF